MSSLSNVLATLVFGLWVGSLVMIIGTLWPAIFLHAFLNALTLIKGFSSTWITPNYLGYLRSAVFELPLVIVGLWMVVRLQRKRIENPEVKESNVNI